MMAFVLSLIFPPKFAFLLLPKAKFCLKLGLGPVVINVKVSRLTSTKHKTSSKKR